MKTLIRTGFLIASLCVASKTYAVTGNQLYGKCKAFDKETLSSSEEADIQFCGGYIMAAYEFIDLENHRTDQNGRNLKTSYGVCIPDGVKSAEAILVYLQYIKESPTMLHEPAAIGVLNAFAKAYQCKR